MNSMEPSPSECGQECGCALPRRDFLKLATLSVASFIPSLPAVAGPFQKQDFDGVAPADKKLSPDWVRSLFLRGVPETYRGAELEKIGMPVGGICSGQLYLGGDGKLWHWDIFNKHLPTADAGYARPPKPDFPLSQGFAIRVSVDGKRILRTLDHHGFQNITFRGEYPIGKVTYQDPEIPITVSLEAFSPFIPLNTADSSLPATILRYTLENSGSLPAEVELTGWLENVVCPDAIGDHQNRILSTGDHTFLECSLQLPKTTALNRPEIVFEDFQKSNYEGWEVTGTAFGTAPVLRTEVPKYQGDLGGPGKRVLNSHASAPGDSIAQKDGATGSLTSKSFLIERNFIHFWIGGGNHPGKTCINLIVDGKIVRSATGHDSNRMRQEAMDVREFAGKSARLQIVDEVSGAWGNIGIADIQFSDKPLIAAQTRPDFGTMGLALLKPQKHDFALPSLAESQLPHSAFPETPARSNSTSDQKENKLLGALGRKVTLQPNGTAEVTFVVSWYFPNLNLKDGGRGYANRFDSAASVAAYISAHFDALAKQTRLWRDTWYDSTLPYWFLDRTFLNTSILATSTAYRFKNGRFYGWEGVGCCEGTCTHVWHYAHAVARLFPELERDLRERTDFGTALDPRTGIIEHRGEVAGLAVDGQAGCILRAYREHQMSPDSTFLKRIWPGVKRAMECLLERDSGTGILTGPQHNTLDQAWFGKVAWLTSLYLAAAKACTEMANEMGDLPFAARCKAVTERGQKSLDEELFNGEYYVQIPEEGKEKQVGSYNGCEIDQVFGQSWAFQVGLGRLQSESHVKKALRALWKYNFTPDVGPFRKTHAAGRWYAMAGEGGLLMCSWPKGEGMRVREGFDFYFNECMTGFEHQVAGHMLWEGMVQEGLAIIRTIHDRYHAARRNPWNEVECGDHYARAMASYGVFLAACGYHYHGPKGHLAFAPRLSPENFRAAFTAAEGWGTYHQLRQKGHQSHTIEVKYGTLRLKSLAFVVPETMKAGPVTVRSRGKVIPADVHRSGEEIHLTLNSELNLSAGQKCEVIVRS